MKQMLFVLCGAGLLLAGVSPSFADTKKSDLEKDGYTCGRIGVGGYECTKVGGKKYYCDNNGSCQSALVLDPRGGGGKPSLRNQNAAPAAVLNRN